MGAGPGTDHAARVSRRLIIRPEAEAELTEAFAWYEERVPGLGAEFLLCVDASFMAILRDPQHHPQVHRSLRRALVRRFPYEIFFVEDDERLVVVSVFHAKRHPKHGQART